MPKGQVKYTVCDPVKFRDVLKEKLNITPAQLGEQMGYSRAWINHTSGRIPQAAAIWLKSVNGIDPSEYAPEGGERLANGLRENTAVLKMVVNGALDEKLFGDDLRNMVRGAVKNALYEYFGTSNFYEMLTDAVKEVLNG